MNLEYISIKVHPGCDCCELNGTLVPDGYSEPIPHTKGWKNGTYQVYGRETFSTTLYLDI